MKRYAIALKFLLGFLATLGMMVILLGWRLSIGPIELDWAGDYLRKALISQEKGIDINFRDATLIWQKEDSQDKKWSSGLQVIFYEVVITDQKNDFTLRVPEAATQFSGLAMLRGLVAPTDLEFSGLSLDYTLGPDAWKSTDDRPFMEKLEAFIENFQKSNSLMLKMTRELLSPPKSTDASGYFRKISLLNTTITLTDTQSGQRWQIPDAQLNLRRTDGGLMVDLSGNIHVGSTNIMPLDVTILYDNDSREAVTIIQFSEMRPSALAGQVEALSGLANLDIPVRGNVNFTVDHNIEIPVLAFSLALGEGLVNPADLYPKPLHISAAALSGFIQKKENTIVLEEISLQLDQTHFSGSGLIYGSVEKPGLVLQADIIDLPFLDLKKYWPGQFGKGAYNWIAKNVDAGVVPLGKLEVNIRPEMWENGSGRAGLPPDVMTFKFDFDNLTAHYLRPMPVLKDVSGHAVLNLRTFKLSASGGTIDQLAIKKADIVFSNIHVKGKGRADITLEIDGSVEEILRVIDYKPLGYPSRYGIKQGSMTGQADAVVNIQFPLLKKIKLKDVTFDVRADVTNLSIPKLNDNLRLQEGQLTMIVNGKGIKAEGKILLNGVDFDMTWQENFDKAVEFPTQYVINGFIEGAEWDQLHLPFDQYIDGPVEIDLALYGKGGKLAKGQGQLNLLTSNSRFAPIGWEKRKGRAGLVTFDLEFNGPGVMKVHKINLKSEEIRAQMELDLVGDRVTRLFISDLKMKDTDIHMLVEWDDLKNHYQASLTGNAFNAAPLIEILMASNEDEERINLPDFDLTANVNNLLTKNNVRINNSQISATYRNSDFSHLTFEGQVSGRKSINITLVPKGNNRQLEFASNDAGEALRGLGLFNLGVAGKILLTAEIVKHERGLSLGGHAKISNFKVIESPGFSKLLAENKFSKAREELNKDGLKFSSFEMEFRQYNGVMEISKGRAQGPMIGMTMEGFVDQTYDEMGITGTLIPAYGLNSLLGNIPLIGTILTGGKGQGIFAATYAVRGSLENPVVTINPLTVFTPGILRTIFRAIGSSKKKTLREKAEELNKIVTDTKVPPDQKTQKK